MITKFTDYLNEGFQRFWNKTKDEKTQELLLAMEMYLENINVKYHYYNPVGKGFHVYCSFTFQDIEYTIIGTGIGDRNSKYTLSGGDIDNITNKDTEKIYQTIKDVWLNRNRNLS